MSMFHNWIARIPRRALWGVVGASIVIAAYAVIILLSPTIDTPEQRHVRSQTGAGGDAAARPTHSPDAENSNERARDEFHAAITEAIGSLTRDGDLRSALQAIEMAVNISGSVPESEARTLLLHADQALNTFFESSAYRDVLGANDTPAELMKDYWKARDVVTQAIADIYLNNPHAQARDSEGFGIALLNAAQFAHATGDPERALAIYWSIANEHAHQLDVAHVAQAISTAGSLATQMGRPELSEAMYDRLIQEHTMEIDSMQAVRRQVAAASNPTRTHASARALDMLLELWHEPFVRENNPATILVAEFLADQLRQQEQPEAAIDVYTDLLARLDRITPEDMQIYTAEFGLTFSHKHRTVVSHIYDLALSIGDYGLAYDMGNLYAEHYDEPTNPSGALMADRARRALERHLQGGTP